MIEILGEPLVIYPVFVMQVMCLALFASAFSILLGYVGILSFGRAAFFGSSTCFCGYMLKEELFHRIVHVPFGEVLRATRELETRARSLGFPVARYKFLAFTLSAALISSLYRCFDAPGGWVTIMVGAIFTLCVMLFRKTVVGELRAALAPRHTSKLSHHEKDSKNAKN